MATERPRGVVPWGSPTLQAVLASTLVLPLGVPLVSPALPVVRDALSLADYQASLLVAVYFLPGVVASPLVGVVIDRRGRRPVLLAALFVFGVSGAGVALEPPFPAILALRAVQGSAAASVFVATVTLLGDAFGGSDRNAVMGTTVATLSVARTVYPVAGGLLAAVAWNAPFVASLLAVPVGLFVSRTLPGSSRQPWADEPAPAGAAAALAPTPGTLALLGATLALEVATFGAIMTALPFLLADRFGLSPGSVGALLAVATLAAAATAAGNGRLAARASNALLVAGSFVCFGIGLLGIWLAEGVVAIGGAAAVFGAGLGVAMPSIDAEIAALVPAARRGGAFSLRNAVTFLGRAAGPVAFTAAAGAVGYGTVMLVAGAATLAIGVGGLTAAR